MVWRGSSLDGWLKLWLSGISLSLLWALVMLELWHYCSKMQSSPCANCTAMHICCFLLYYAEGLSTPVFNLVNCSDIAKCDMLEFSYLGHWAEAKVNFLKRQCAKPSLLHCCVHSSHCSEIKFFKIWLILYNKEINSLWFAARRYLLFHLLEVMFILILCISCLLPHPSTITAHCVSNALKSCWLVSYS